MTSLIADSFSCMGEVLAQYQAGTAEYTDMENEFGNLYYKKNMGIWVTESDLQEAHTFCEDRAEEFYIDTDYCMGTIAMISSAGVSYADASSKQAIDGNGFFLYVVRKTLISEFRIESLSCTKLERAVSFLAMNTSENAHF